MVQILTLNLFLRGQPTYIAMVHRNIVHLRNGQDGDQCLGSLLALPRDQCCLILYLLSECCIGPGRLRHVAHILLLLLFIAPRAFQGLTMILIHLKWVTRIDYCAVNSDLVRVALLMEDGLLGGWGELTAVFIFVRRCNVSIEEVGLQL